MTMVKKARRKMPVFLFMIFVFLFSITPVMALDPQPEPPAPAAPTDISVIIDGKLLRLDVSPIIVDGRTLVPMRAIFEALGAEVSWDGQTQSIKATKGNIIINMQIGSKTVFISNNPSMLDVPAQIYSGRTLVPLRFVGQAMGGQVNWDGNTKRVIIVTEGTKPQITPDTNGTLPGSETTTPGNQGTEPGIGDTTPDVQIPGPSDSIIKIPDSIINGLKLPSIDKNFDTAFINRDKLLIKPIDISNITVILPKMDYSSYLTFTGNQDGWGGCIGRSIVHVMDINNEREHPYTPDLSFWYLHRRQEQLANGGPVNTKNLIENYGLCTEGSLPSDYDEAKINNGAADFSTMPQPGAVHDQEAAYYKVKLFSDPVTPDEKTIKKLVAKYGPVLISGPFDIILGPQPHDSHCLTVVGWDDTKSAFKILNSWGDKWNGDGFYWLKYSDLAANATAVRYIQDGPTDRSGTKYAYSARINLKGSNAYRKDLTIKIGVEGKTPWTFWDRPNRENCIDNSNNLCIDIPLPEYAADNWPPSSSKQWYIEVTNNGSGSGSFELKEFTLARQYKKSNGTLDTETFSATQTGTVIKGGDTKKIYIPAKQIRRISSDLSLQLK